MHKALIAIAKVMAFLAFVCLIVDIGNLSRAKDNLKDALDLSSKSAAMQVDEDPTKIAEGTFEIDNNKAQAAFLEVMSGNTDMSKDQIKSCMIDYRAINTPCDYYNAGDKKTYKLKYPTFIALMRYKFRGIFLKKEIILDNNFAASQLRTK